jgi:hypothetical protein
MTIMARKPPDGDEIARSVRPALRPEDQVVQRGVLDVLTADTATAVVAFNDRVPHLDRYGVRVTFQI